MTEYMTIEELDERLEKHENDATFQRHYDEWNDDQRAEILCLNDDEFYKYIAAIESADYEIDENKRNIKHIQEELDKLPKMDALDLMFAVAEGEIDEEIVDYMNQLNGAIYAYSKKIGEYREYQKKVLARY